MTDDQNPRRMKEMMGDLEVKTSDPIIAQEKRLTTKSSQLEFIIQSQSSITLCGYVDSHQELKIDYEMVSTIHLPYMESEKEIEPKIEVIQDCGFILMGPHVKESVPGLDTDELKIIGHKSYSSTIPDTGEAGVYSLTLTNNNIDDWFKAKVRVTFSTGVWTVK